MEAFPIPNQEAVSVADKLVNEVFMRFGIPILTKGHNLNHN